MNLTAAPRRKSFRIYVILLVLCASFTAASCLPASAQAKPRTQTHMTDEDAKKLFALVDQLLKFSSEETGLPIKSDVKRQLTTREAVESYLVEKFNEDDDAKRMQRSEIVLKKFGLLERDFDLKPFLLALLKEQIEAYYDPKTKTVNLLDWIGVDEQKPVLAHELTHALQDQHVDLEKWSDQTPPEVSTNIAGDADHLAKDELDTARDAVTEGQATAVMMDNMLKPLGHSLVKDPEIVETIKQQMNAGSDSPVLSRAPTLLSESLLFPYREGLSFEQDVWMDKGQAAAFAGALDRPPASSWEIMNPREYEKGHRSAIPLLPNIHPLLDPLYKPYDIGQVGQLDTHILTTIFGGESASRDLTPAWDGGLYWAGQRRSATAAEKSATGSIALLYLSAWKSPESARSFAALYARALGRKYSGLHPDTSVTHAVPAGSIDEQIYSTSEGTVAIFTRDKLAFVTESFDLPLARHLAALILDAQGEGEMRLAGNALEPLPGASLSGSMVRFLSHCGVMKAAVDATIQAAR
ncbi:MAG: hypothetical protein P4L40_17730 [Terracidiphilus sp.]|nr:hypothetical protein [Terracidiphilus sp.]